MFLLFNFGQHLFKLRERERVKAWLTVIFGKGDFDLAVDPEPAVVPGEDDAQGERGVDQRVVEVVLSSNCRSFLEIDLWML